MPIDNHEVNEYNNEIYTALKEVNTSIINSYKTIKDYDFHFCRKKNSGIFVNWENYLGEFSLKNKLFRFKYRVFQYCFDADKAESYFNIRGLSQEINQYNTYSRDILHLIILEGRRAIDARISINDMSARFRNLDDFARNLSKNHNNFENEEIISQIYSNLPKEMLSIYENYTAELKEKNQRVLSNINKNLQNYKDSVNYAEIYETQPEIFLEILRSLPEKDRELAFGQLFKTSKFQRHKKIDDILSSEFGKIIDSAGRKGM